MRTFFAVSFACIHLLSCILYAVPIELSHQGRILDSNGDPIADGTYDVTYRLYDAPTNGTLLWEEIIQTQVEDGLFSATLGTSGNPLDFSSFDSPPDSVWLEIQVGADPPISPRTKLTASPVAAVSKGLHGDVYTAQGEMVFLDSQGDTAVYIDGISDAADTMVVIRRGIILIRDLNTEVVYASFASQGMVLTNPSGDTTVVVKSQDDGVISSHTWTQTGGPFKFSTQSIADDSGSGLSAVSISGTLDTSGIFIDAGTNGGTLALVRSNGDTSVVIESPWEPHGGGTIRIEEKSDNGQGEETKKSFAVAGESFILDAAVSDGMGGFDLTGRVVVSPDSLALVDGNGKTRGALKKGDAVLLVGFGNLSGGSDPDTSFAVDTLGNAQFAGNVTVGPVESLAELSVAGDICATGAIGACSDGRFKTDVRTLNNSLERVLQLRGVDYRWKQDQFPKHKFDDEEHIGFIAQEVEKLFPEMVMTDANGYKSIDYGRLTPVLVEAVKEQQQQIDQLKALVEKLLNSSSVSKTARISTSVE